MSTLIIDSQTRQCIKSIRNVEEKRMDWVVSNLEATELVGGEYTLAFTECGTGGLDEVVKLLSSPEWEHEVSVGFFRVSVKVPTGKNNMIRYKYVHVLFTGPSCAQVTCEKVMSLDHGLHEPFYEISLSIRTRNPSQDVTPEIVTMQLSNSNNEGVGFDFRNIPAPDGMNKPLVRSSSQLSEEDTLQLLDETFAYRDATADELIQLLVKCDHILSRSEHKNLRIEYLDKFFRKRVQESKANRLAQQFMAATHLPRRGSDNRSSGLSPANVGTTSNESTPRPTEVKTLTPLSNNSPPVLMTKSPIHAFAKASWTEEPEPLPEGLSLPDMEAKEYESWTEKAGKLFDSLVTTHNPDKLTMTREVFKNEMSIEYHTPNWMSWGADRMFDQMCEEGEDTLSREAFVKGMAQYRFLRQIIARDPKLAKDMDKIIGKAQESFKNEKEVVINRMRAVDRAKGLVPSPSPLSKYSAEKSLVHDKVISDRYLKTKPNPNPWLVIFTSGQDDPASKVQAVEWMDRSGVLPLELFVYLDPKQMKKDHRSASGRFLSSLHSGSSLPSSPDRPLQSKSYAQPTFQHTGSKSASGFLGHYEDQGWIDSVPITTTTTNSPRQTPRHIHALSRTASVSIVDDSEADWICLVTQEAAMRAEQHVVLFLRQPPSHEYMMLLRKDFAKYRIACVLVQEGIRPDPSIRPELITPPEVSRSSVKGVFDLVVWVETKCASGGGGMESAPPSIQVGGRGRGKGPLIHPPLLLAVQNNQGLWHQSLGRLFSDDFDRRRPFPDSLETLYICPTKLGEIFCNKKEEYGNLEPGHVLFEQLSPPGQPPHDEATTPPGAATSNTKKERPGMLKKQHAFRQENKKKMLLMCAYLDQDKAERYDISSLHYADLEVTQIMDSNQPFYKKEYGLEINYETAGDRLNEHLQDKWAWHVICHSDSVFSREPTLCLGSQAGGLLLYSENKIVDFCREASVANGGKLTIIVLNTCRCGNLARRLSEEAGIPYVITWETKVFDRAASFFAGGFWTSLAEDLDRGGEDPKFFDVEDAVTHAFKEGKKSVAELTDMTISGGGDMTVIMSKEDSAGVLKLYRQRAFMGVKPSIKVRLTVFNPHEMPDSIPATDFRRILTELHDGQCMLKISPINRTTLDPIARERARIPESARYYCFASSEKSPSYVQVMKQFSRTNDVEMDPNLLFFRNGGYIYFDRNMHIVQVNAVTMANGQAFGILNFQTPVILKTAFKDEEQVNDIVRTLEDMGRFSKVTIDIFAKANAQYFAWIYPNEIIARYQFPQHGSFLFLFRELDQGITVLDRYFAVRGRKVA